MTKKDIIYRISEETGLKQIDVKEVVQRTFDIIVDSLSMGKKVELRNLVFSRSRPEKGEWAVIQGQEMVYPFQTKKL